MLPTEFFKCLADETRLRCLLLILKQDELCVCELMAALNESQPKISRHLAHLRQAGLLQDRREGRWVYYRLNPALPDWATRVLSSTLKAEAEHIDVQLQRLQQTQKSQLNLNCSP